MTEMVEMVIDSIRASLMSAQRVVVLRARDAQRYLPIWVGSYEADAISVALQEVETIRPLTQDLLKNIITLFGGKVLRVEVVSLKDDIFYGSIVVETGGEEHVIDSRPSDAIALAVRTHAPILVHPSVLDEAGIVPEKDMQAGIPTEIAPPSPPEPPPPADEKRLDVFEDFLKKIDGDADSTPPKEQP